MKRLSIAALGLCLLLGSAACGDVGKSKSIEGSTEATTEVAREWVTYGSGQKIRLMHTQPAETQRLAEEASEFADWNSKESLGSYVDGNSRVHVVVGTPKGQALARAAFAGEDVAIDLASVTSHEVSDLGSALREESTGMKKLSTWGGEPQIGGMFVEFAAKLTDADRRTIEAFAAEHEVPIRVSRKLSAFGSLDPIESAP